MTNTIQLSDASIQELTDLCQVVLRKNPNNEISVNMARGISEYIATNGIVTEKQALWLARNLDFYRIKRPPELADVVIEKKFAPAKTDTSFAPHDAFQIQLISSLIRKLQL